MRGVGVERSATRVESGLSVQRPLGTQSLFFAQLVRQAFVAGSHEYGQHGTFCVMHLPGPAQIVELEIGGLGQPS